MNFDDVNKLKCIKFITIYCNSGNIHDFLRICCYKFRYKPILHVTFSRKIDTLKLNFNGKHFSDNVYCEFGPSETVFAFSWYNIAH